MLGEAERFFPGDRAAQMAWIEKQRKTNAAATNINLGGAKGWGELNKAAGTGLAEAQAAGLNAGNVRYLVKAFQGLQSGAYEGKLAEFKTDLVGWAKAVGVGDETLSALNIDDRQGQTEFLRSVINQMTLQRRTSVRDPQLNAQENQILQQAGALLNGSREGNEAVVFLMDKYAQWQERLANKSHEFTRGAMTDQTELGPYDAYSKLWDYSQANPVLTDDDVKEMEKILSGNNRPPGIPDNYIFNEELNMWSPP